VCSLSQNPYSQWPAVIYLETNSLQHQYNGTAVVDTWMTNHWYYYPKPACYTETVLSKLGGGNSVPYWLGTSDRLPSHPSHPASWVWYSSISSSIKRQSVDCSLPVCLCWNHKSCTSGGYIGSQSSQHIHQYATLMSPNRGETAVCGSTIFCFGMTGEAITGSQSVGRSYRPPACLNTVSV